MPNMDTLSCGPDSRWNRVYQRQRAPRRIPFFRHTLATNLAKGTAPRVAMEIMRHSDMWLTAKTYTDAGLLPMADAVLSLPSLVKTPNSWTQIRPQSLVREGQNGSVPVINNDTYSHSQDDENQTVARDHSSPGRTCQKSEKMGRTGFEPVKAKPEDLQSSPVGHLGICPIKPRNDESSRVLKAMRLGGR